MLCFFILKIIEKFKNIKLIKNQKIESKFMFKYEYFTKRKGFQLSGTQLSSK